MHVALGSAKTKFPKKADYVPGVKLSLRMVHQYIQLNAATIIFNYPMKRMESIVNTFGQKKWKVYFKADAANGYWAIPLAKEHAYKTAFHCIFGQYCYLRMGQGLTGAPGTYVRLKDLVTGQIPEP